MSIRKKLDWNGRACFIPAGCSKWPSSKAAVSEMPRRTFPYVEVVSDARTQLAVIFNNLNKGGDRNRRGY
jgi:hypothetical protein